MIEMNNMPENFINQVLIYCKNQHALTAHVGDEEIIVCTKFSKKNFIIKYEIKSKKSLKFKIYLIFHQVHSIIFFIKIFEIENWLLLSNTIILKFSMVIKSFTWQKI